MLAITLPYVLDPDGNGWLYSFSKEALALNYRVTVRDDLVQSAGGHEKNELQSSIHLRAAHGLGYARV